MDSYTPKKKRLEESDLHQTADSERLRIEFPTTHIISGTYKETEPSNNRFQPMTGRQASQITGSTRTRGRVALSGANRVLSDEQIRHFITSTVIPHHRSLARAESNFLTNKQVWQSKPTHLGEELNKPRAFAQISSQTPNITQRTQRETTVVPQEIPVPQRTPGFISSPQQIQNNATTAQKEIYLSNINNDQQGMPSHTVGISQEASEETGFPQDVQEEISRENNAPKIATVLHEIQGENTWISPRMPGVEQENHGGVVNYQQRQQGDASLPQRTDLSTNDPSVHCQQNDPPSQHVLSKTDEENDEVVDEDIEKFLQQFTPDKLNMTPWEPPNTRIPLDVSPWDPEYTLIPVDRYTCQELLGSERFIPSQDCFIDLNLFL